MTDRAGMFVFKYVRDQCFLLKVEDENLQDILDVRQEEGMPMSANQMQRLEELDQEMQTVGQAIKEVKGLVEVAVEMRLVEGDVDFGTLDNMGDVDIATRNAEANKVFTRPGEQAAEVEVEGQVQVVAGEEMDMDMNWKMDPSFDGF